MRGSCVIPSLIFFAAISGAARAQDFSQRSQSQPAPPSLDIPQSPQTQCLQLTYNRYVTRGVSAQNAWNNAVRDCSFGIDLSCVEFAYRHHLSQGRSDSQAYNNALRDCRNLIRRY
jgi:hypothetical protein